MKKKIFLASLILIIVTILAACSFGFQSSGSTKAAPQNPLPYAMFDPKNDEEIIEAILKEDIVPDHLIIKTSHDFDINSLKKGKIEVVGAFTLGSSRYYRLKVINGNIRALINSIRMLPGIEYAEYELRSHIPDPMQNAPIDENKPSSKGASEIRAVLNDPETWGRFGHFEITKALDAYKAYGVGTNEVYVAIVDSGINRIHEDFIKADNSQVVVRALSAFNANGSFVGNEAQFVEVPQNENWDDVGHGSHTAGIIAALGNNEKGIAGVAWKNVKLISYKCFSDTSNYSGSDWAVYGGLADLIQWKKNNNISQTIPVNMSLGGSYAGWFEIDMINQALENGIMIVASMGNDGYNYHKYPASYTGVMAVGATRADGTKVHFSTSGSHISVSAPGYNIYSTYNKNNTSYTDMSGTSMAAPFVTGTIAYLLTFNPNLKPSQLRTIIESTATDIGEQGWDEDTGYGLVNVKAAIDKVKHNQIPADGSMYSNKCVSIYVKNINENYNSGIQGVPKAMPGIPVYLYDSNGNYVYLSYTSYRNGKAEFRMLKPGTYKAVTNYWGIKKETTFTLSSQDITKEIEYNIQTGYIQTLHNLAKDSSQTSGADTVLSIYDKNQNLIFGPFDYDFLDEISMNMTRGEELYLLIEPYDLSSTGEYGLWIGWSQKSNTNTTEGRGNNLDDLFEENDSFSQAAQISFETEYGLYLGDADWFKFTVP
jgi:hypothetical protein